MTECSQRGPAPLKLSMGFFAILALLAVVGEIGPDRGQDQTARGRAAHRRDQNQRVITTFLSV